MVDFNESNTRQLISITKLSMENQKYTVIKTMQKYYLFKSYG